MTTAPLAPISRHVLKTRKRQPLIEWARANIRITEGPKAEFGHSRFDPDWFPLQVAPLAELDKPGAEVVIVGPPQAGKTLLQIIFLANQICERGRKALYFNATKPAADIFWEDKFQDTIGESPELKRFLPQNRDDKGKSFFRKFTNGGRLKIVGSESASPLASSTSPIVVGDDVQDMPATISQRGKSRGHPCDLGTKRARSFAPAKRAFLFCGTAGADDDWHWRRLKASTLYVPYLPCPGCGVYQWLDFGRMMYDESDPIATAESAYLRCANGSCQYQITHRDLPAMLPRVRWVSCAGLEVAPATVEIDDEGRRRRASDTGAVQESDGTFTGRSDNRNNNQSENVRSNIRDVEFRRSDRAGRRGAVAHEHGGCSKDFSIGGLIYPASRVPSRTCGFWYNAFYWPNSDWGALCADWLAAKGNPDAEASFRQNTLVIPSSPPKVESIPEETFAKLIDPAHRWGTIPREADCHGPGGILLVTVDPGGGFIWYQVHAWRFSDSRSWLVELGRIGSKSDVSMVTTKAEKLEIWAAEALAALRELNSRAADGWPVLGTGEIVLPTCCYVDRGFAVSAADTMVREYNGWKATFGSTSRSAPLWPEQASHKDGAEFFEIGVHRAKFEYRSLFVPGAPMAVTLPGDMPDLYARLLRDHMAGELYDEMNGKWKRVGDNHYFDTGSLQIVAARDNDVNITGVSDATAMATTHRPEQATVANERWSRDGLPFLATQRGNGGWR